jgi:outer membrane protein assembly factor BamA
MGNLGQLFAELRSEHVLVEEQKPDRPTIQNTEIRTFAIRSIADKRDRIDFPTKGFYNYWAWESGNELLLKSQESYTRLLVNLEGYFTYADLHTWHLHLFAGVGDKTVPFSENFRLGGLQNFYGLYKNELYGRQLFQAGLEYRILLPLKLRKNLLF